MYHSIIFSNGTRNSEGRLVGKNTWEDWHLLPSLRPVVAQSSVVTSFVDIPGRLDGPIDMSEYLTGKVVYGQRSGSFDFYVDNDHEYWETIRMNIAKFLHGKNLYMVLEDDPDYYYEGRFSLNNFASEAVCSKVTINYALKPYKYYLYSGMYWLWDPFNFETDNTEDLENLRREL